MNGKKIKIFQAVWAPYEALTPYMRTFMTCISSKFGDIQWGWNPNKFWSNDILSFDIIHVHWPNLLLQGREPALLKKRLLELKKKGILIVSTCHNFVPHYCNESNQIEAYNIVYSLSDYMIHLGTYSLNIQTKAFPNTKHIHLPHHVYDQVYTNILNKRYCCEKLGISAATTNILCFGAFRSDEERQFVIDVAKHLKKNRCKIIAPNFWGFTNSSLKTTVFNKLKSQFIKYKYNIITGKTKNVPDEQLPLYYGAADIAFIQRKKILNSGTLPMALYMGKVVVGPDTGNVSELITETGNFLFNPGNTGSTVEAIKRALHCDLMKKGKENHNFAIENLNTDKISTRLHDIYFHIYTNNLNAMKIQGIVNQQSPFPVGNPHNQK